MSAVAKKTTKTTRKSRAGNGATVVEGLAETAKVVKLDTKKKGPKPGTPGSKEWHAKYQHVVIGSVRTATPADVKTLGGEDKCHGKVCVVKCVDTKEERVVNVQDAFQCKRTVEAQRNFERRRRAERRLERKKARQYINQLKASKYKT